MELARDASDFIDRLGRLPTADQVRDAIEHTLARYGFEAFTFCGIPRDGRSLAELTLARRIPAELQKIYAERRYADISPVFRLLRRTVEPFEWLDVPYDPEREPQAVELFQLVADFGLSQGFIVPIPSPAGVHGSVWMAGSKPELTAQTKPLLRLIALHAFGRVHRLVGPLPNAGPRVTAREREVLTWVAQGKTTREVSEILGLAERTVDEHVARAGCKLGAANRTHAVAIALRERII